MNAYVLLMDPEGLAWPLELDPVTMPKAQQMVNWQRVSAGRDDWRIGKIVNGQMVDQLGNVLRVKQGPYTREVFERFAAKLNAEEVERRAETS